MKEYQYRKMDAFTFGSSLGNPAACIWLEDKHALTDAQMQEIARQHKGFVSEMVFCQQMNESSVWLAYYSSECQVAFCGHGTVACLYGLIRENPSLMQQKQIHLHTAQKGLLCAYNEIAQHDAVFIDAPQAQHIGTQLNESDIAKALDLPIGGINREKPIDVIDAGLRTLIIPISQFKHEVELFPLEHSLKRFCEESEIDIILIYCMETVNKEAVAHTRVFAPRFGYLEDPATGSGNSAFGSYMIKNGLWDGRPVMIEQGGSDREYNAVQLRVMDGRLQFGGRATTRIKGVYRV